MSAIRQNVVEVDVTHGDCVPENKLGTGSDAWTKTYFVCAVEDFQQYAGFIEKQQEVSYRINRKRVEAYRILVREKFKDRFSQYRGKGEKFEGNCSALTSQTDDPVVGISIRVNGDRVFMKFADGRDPNAHALREILFESISRLMLQEVGEQYEIYPVVVYNELSLSEGQKSESSECEDVRYGDWMTVALKLFQRQRAGESGPNGWASYDAWAKAARETFAKVDAGMLVAADFDYADFARKFVYNPTVANVFFKDHEEDEKSEVGNFISQNRQTPKAASWYLEKDNLPKVKGLGVGCALNFMMKVRPVEFATYSPMIDKALMSVGLLAKPLPPEPTVESYEQCKALQGQVLAKMHELKVGKAADDDSPADYLTVNEFAWWLSDETNQNLIKEKVMSAQLKPVDSKKTVIKGNRALSDAFKDDEMLKRLAAALRTKPFAILAGHSGTGKSQLVRRLAYMTCNNQKLVDEGKDKTAPGNYCMVQVKPNWHDSTDLLGYYSDLGTRHFVNTAFVQFLCKAYAYPETPFFLCLDEMNLAPVEQYFAEYLSAVESLEKKGGDWVSDSLIEIVKTGEKDENGNAKVDEEILGQIIAGAQSTEAADWIRKHGLTIPKNLFVVGTVNMDETTCQFSRKVLDRAMTLLMNEVKFAEMGKSVDPSKEQLLDDAGVAFFMQGSRRGHVDTVEAGLLDNLNKPLANTPFVVAYRFANEYALYEEALANLNGVPQLDEGEADEAKIAEHWKKVSEHAVDALDHVVLMKLLPRIHGMKDVVKGIFEGRKIAEKDTPGLKDEVKADGLSAGIMTEILNRGDEYLTFWP